MLALIHGDLSFSAVLDQGGHIGHFSRRVDWVSWVLQFLRPSPSSDLDRWQQQVTRVVALGQRIFTFDLRFLHTSPRGFSPDSHTLPRVIICQNGVHAGFELKIGEDGHSGSLVHGGGETRVLLLAL